ncbi:MAG TPA: class I SAM-dependent methyltransferase [Acidimicrobiales bacterium]|nr:class I SAM-dependent methyltransferase [Acidimicrobiales bacterium]
MAKAPALAETLRPVVERIVGADPPVAFRFWDGSVLGAAQAPATIVVRSPLALRYLLWAPGELGLGRAYVSGELDLEGDVYAALSLRERLGAPPREHPVGAVDPARDGAEPASCRDGDPRLRVGITDRLRLLGAARRIGALGLPPPAPPEEARLSGRRHSRERDAAAIAHHYDISNDFYRLVLGETMTYSCAYFDDSSGDLDDAQRAKYELICQKLGLRPGMRLLDVGCGWGGMVIHAAREHGVRAVGITISAEQAARAQERAAEAGCADRVEIRLQDYRDVVDGPFHAISSIGMFEHVGLERLTEYFSVLRALLPEGGRLLNHAISRPKPAHTGRISSRWRGAGFAGGSFVERYVFPDGELLEVGAVVSAMQRCGLEARDVECLREHYGRTLRAWVGNLEAHFDEAVRLVGAGRARVWRLYMAASALNFEANRTSIDQVLAVRTGTDGWSGMPGTRPQLLGWTSAASGGEAFAEGPSPLG